MKRMYVLLLVVSFLALGAQAMASPPVSSPTEGFLITTNTEIFCTGSVTEKETFDWTYFEGTGAIGVTSGTDSMGHALIPNGWQEGAQVAYQQTFTSMDGTTTFNKGFEASSHTVPNLVVSKLINFQPTTGFATALANHTEKVGLSVVSAGGNSVASAAGLLTLCPWATSASNGGYPATNEGIAAGSSFKVTEILNFTSDALVTSTDIPKLSYVVDAPSGKGTISAGMVVELWEGATPWNTHTGTVLNPGLATTTAIARDAAPAVKSRTSYSEHATATGVWRFKKEMAYESVFTGVNVQNPINLVP